MHRNVHFHKVIKVFIVTFLCSELQSSLIMKTSSITSVNYAYAFDLNATYATLKDSKHHASVRLTALDDNFGEGHICSGALIASSAVLTAAQCVFNYVQNFQRHPSELRVVMGTPNRYQRTQQTLVYSVTHLYIPPTFDSQTLRDNIAILMLDSNIMEHSHVKPIAIEMDSVDAILSRDFKVTSWLSTEKGDPVPSLMLLNATLSTDIPCHRSYGKLHANNMICVNFMDVNQSPCPYDAGAPLLVDNKLVGLSSIVHDCSIKSSPSIYVDVRQHLGWIKRNIGDGTSQNSSVWGTIAFLLFTAFALKSANFQKRRCFGDF